MISAIHHINFIVHDLDDAIERFEKTLGQPVASVDRLPDRGVLTARFRLGVTWLVLVQPQDPDSAPGRFLSERGEGFFLLSLATDDLAAEQRRIEATGLGFSGDSRPGLDDWRVRDLNPSDTLGVQLQLAEETGAATLG